MYSCRVERDSISPAGKRLESFVITAPRIVLAELVTHRVGYDSWGECEISWCERTTDRSISKSSASSRAIPFEKMLEKVLADPYMPDWTINQKGMQGSAVTDETVIETANLSWRAARDYLIGVARHLHSIGIHKQDCNRLLEPWAWVTQIVTSSQWDNFLSLRCHEAAHPAFRTVARMMFFARRKSTPVLLQTGQWHLPFVPLDQQMSLNWIPVWENGVLTLPDLVKFSAARCGWVSYENHDRDGTPEQMLRTFNRFTAEIPVHACYDSETEVLTMSGWKKWPDVDGTEMFATLSSDGMIEYQPSSRLVANDHRGQMISVRTQHVNLLVTPGHNMLASRRTKDGYQDWSLVPIEDFYDAPHKISHGGGDWVGSGNLPAGWGELLGFFIGDGSYSKETYSTTFHLRKRRKIEFLHKQAAIAGFKVTCSSDDRYYLSCSKEFKALLEDCYRDKEKTIPRSVMFMEKATLLAILRGLIFSDGSISKTGKTTYSSTSSRLVDDFQELALKCGEYASSRISSLPRASSWGGAAKACYSLCLFRSKRFFSRIGHTIADRNREIKTVDYSGKVYCVTVPNGVIYVRRCGKAAWCGNSPVEHQATPEPDGATERMPELRSNLVGWIQARKLIPHEVVTNFQPPEDQIASWKADLERRGISV